MLRMLEMPKRCRASSKRPRFHSKAGRGREKHLSRFVRSNKRRDARTNTTGCRGRRRCQRCPRFSGKGNETKQNQSCPTTPTPHPPGGAARHEDVRDAGIHGHGCQGCRASPRRKRSRGPRDVNRHRWPTSRDRGPSSVVDQQLLVDADADADADAVPMIPLAFYFVRTKNTKRSIHLNLLRISFVLVARWTRSYWVLPGFTGFYRVLIGIPPCSIKVPFF